MKKTNRLLVALLTATAITVSASAIAATNIVTVNGVGISQRMFEQEVQRAIKSGANDTPQLREAIRRQMIANELIYQEAQKQRLDKSPELIRAAENAKRQLMADLYIAKYIKPQPVSEIAVKEEYENFKARLGSQEYRIRVIQTSSEASAQQALRQVRSGQDFVQVAQRNAMDPTLQAGASNWISFKTPAQEGNTNGLPLSLAQAIERLKVGEVSSVINSNDSWWIIKLEEVRPTRVPKFEDLKDEIRSTLNARATDVALSAKLEQLYKQAKIQ